MDILCIKIVVECSGSNLIDNLYDIYMLLGINNLNLITCVCMLFDKVNVFMRILSYTIHILVVSELCEYVFTEISVE